MIKVIAEIRETFAVASAFLSADQRPSQSPGLRRLARILAGKPPSTEAPPSGATVFWRLMAGSTISMLGSRISTIAFPMLALYLNRSPFMAGLLTCVTTLPSLLTSLPAGALVDRWDPWRVMLTSQLMRGIAMTAVVISLFAFRAHVSVYLLIYFMVAEEVLEIFWMLADQRYLSQLTESGKTGSRWSSIEVRAHAAALAGRPVGPFLFTISPFLPFSADAISFGVSIWTILALGRRGGASRNPQDKSSRQLHTEIGEGFRWLVKNRGVGGTQLLMSFTTLISQALIMMFLAEASDRRLSTMAIGAVLAASGAGGAIGSLVAGRLPNRVRKSWVKVQLGAWSLALGLLALTGVQFSWCIAVVMLVLGLTGSIGNIEFGMALLETLLKNGEEHLQGRIMSIGQLLVIAATGLGPFLGGGAIQYFGVQVAVELFFFLVLIVTTFSFSIPRFTRPAG